MSGDAPSGSIDAVLYDLDGTLYPTGNGYVGHVRQNLYTWMHDRLGIEDPVAVWRPLFERYNQTLRGLKCSGYVFDEAEYWSTTRNGAEGFIIAAPQDLVGMLTSLKSVGKKLYIVTNCNEVEAQNILELLGIAHLFESIYGATFMGDSCKPEPEAFQKVLSAIGVQGRHAVLFEDSYKNCVSAKQLGMLTVLINSDTAIEEGVTANMHGNVDAVLLDSELSESALRKALPQLWDT